MSRLHAHHALCGVCDDMFAALRIIIRALYNLLAMRSTLSFERLQCPTTTLATSRRRKVWNCTCCIELLLRSTAGKAPVERPSTPEPTATQILLRVRMIEERAAEERRFFAEKRGSLAEEHQLLNSDEE